MRLAKFLLSLALLLSVSAQEGADTTTAQVADEAGVAEDDFLAETVAEDPTARISSDTEDSPAAEEETESIPSPDDNVSVEMPVQNGPFIDLFGPTLLALEMTSPSTAQLHELLTNDALQGKKVIGLYFSADWCGPCKQFTPELAKFYDNMNQRRGKKDEFQIVWISRCRDVESYGQYFTEMPWIALPPQEAMGERGQWLGEKYSVKGIPTLVLLDDVGNVITKDARTMIPKDKAGIGFPWRNPLATLYMTVLPRSLRLMIKSQLGSVKDQLLKRIQTVLRPQAA